MKNEVLQSACGRVTITPYSVGPTPLPFSLLTSEYKLLHVRAVLGYNSRTPSYSLEAVARYDATNAVDWIYVPESRKMKTTELNQLKGILSLLVVHPSFQSGTETDSSGICQVFYATVDDRSDSGLVGIIDKEKAKCTPIQYPLDTWNLNAIPVQTSPQNGRMLIRYRFDTVNGTLLQVVAYEQQEINLFSQINVANIQLASWQELTFLKSTPTDSGVLDEMSDFSSSVTDKLAEKLTKSSNRITHLGTLFPLEREEVACSLNTHIYHSESDASGSSWDSHDEARLLPLLRNLFENARNSLQQDQLGQTESLHNILQLIRLLRCLRYETSTVNLLSEASRMAPPGIEPSILYRQYGTWRDRLTDVLVSCGTRTCTSVLLNRLDALTQAANLTEQSTAALTMEVLYVRKMLFLTLWPAMAHLNQVDNDFYEQLFAACDLVIQKSMRTICLMTLANLYGKTKGISSKMTDQLTEGIYPYLTLHEGSKLPQEKSKIEEPGVDLDSKLLIGLSLVKTVGIPSFFKSVFRLIVNQNDVSPTIRAYAVQLLPKLIEHTDTDKRFDQINQLRRTFGDLLVHSLNDTENDLVIGRALFVAILSLYPSAVELIQLMDQLASEKRWPLVRTCRILLSHACAMEQITEAECVCIHNHCPGFRSLGYSGGWSGLAVPHEIERNEFTAMRGDLFNINDSLIADYSLHLIHGPQGEFRQSNLWFDLLSAHGERRLFEFNIYTEGMETFSVTTTRRPKSQKSKSSAWVSVELKYLQNRLPPWTVFTGGLRDMLQLLWSAPSEPTAVLQVTQVAVDQRHVSFFGTGWVIRVDALGLLSVQIDGALESSVWTQSGRSLVRVRLGTVCELRVHAVSERSELAVLSPAVGSIAVRGAGAQSTLDFVTHIQVGSLPEGICMAMNRQSSTILSQWEANHPVHELWLRGRQSSAYRELTNPADYHVDRFVVQGTSYDLGKNNSRRCISLNSKTQW